MTGFVDVSVREARGGDLPAMQRAKADAGAAAWPHILPPEVIAQLGFPERWRQAVVAPGPRTVALVAELDGGVAGFAILRPAGDDDAGDEIGELDGFYVAPEAWSRGVGRALLAATVARLRAWGFREATLWTAEANHRPRRIYEAAGWTLDGAVKHRELFGAEFDEVRYRLRL